MLDMFETRSFDILQVNQQRMANARTIGLRGEVSVQEWLWNNMRMMSWWPIWCVMITYHPWEYSVFETFCQDMKSWRSLHGMSNTRCELCILGECLWDQTHTHWLGMCLSEEVKSRIWVTSTLNLDTTFPKWVKFLVWCQIWILSMNERMVLQYMEYCNKVWYSSISIWFGWSIAMLKTL